MLPGLIDTEKGEKIINNKKKNAIQNTGKVIENIIFDLIFMLLIIAIDKLLRLTYLSIG